MRETISKNKFLIAAAVVIICVISSIAVYRSSSTTPLDTSEYKDLYKSIHDYNDEKGFASQDELKGFITAWADQRGLDYSTDKYGNIVFTSQAISRKKKVSPTVVCAGYNYETATDHSRLLASALMTAATEGDSGKKTVILCNDEQNLGTGYKHISKKLIPSNAKVIYMDYGSSSYLSNSSFVMSKSSIIVPAKKTKVKCDTAVTVHISGLKSDEVSTALAKHPDVISAFSSLLTRLKSKSTICQLADVKIGANGNMYPISLDATFLLNSYAAGSFTSFIDKRIKAWEKAYGDSNEDLEFSYEVTDDIEKLPKKAYTAESTDRLTSVLYTINNDIYRYEESDKIPENRKVGDTCGLNCALDLEQIKGGFSIDIMTQGYNDSYIKKIQDENELISELYDCKTETKYTVPRFINNRDSLIRNLLNTYSKVNNVSTASSILAIDSDNYFTPCSYLNAINKKADIVHVRFNKDTSVLLTNTILCYINTKGNLLSL
ncbi:MAG: hypothetical protein IJH95_07410 [Mogibacterium sp.]|nr:hypothetical protein [Mogibacterium sp.]